MGKRFLIHTNVIIDHLKKVLPSLAQKFVNKIMDEEFNVSVITRLEILGYQLVTQEVNVFMNLATTFALDKDVEVRTIEIRKQKKIKLPDAIIAATALVNNFTIISRNEKIFRELKG